MASGKVLRIGDQEFDLRLDFFLCARHGLFVPSRFDEEWTTDDGCPVVLGEPHDFCGEHLTPVFLDNLVPEQVGGGQGGE